MAPHSTTLLTWVCVLTANLGSASSHGPALTLEYVDAAKDPSSFRVLVDGVPWFSSAGAMLTAGGVTYHSAGHPTRSWTPLGGAAASPLLTQHGVHWSKGSDGMGPYDLCEITWVTAATRTARMVTSVRNYSAGVVKFTQSFPDGLADCSVPAAGPHNNRVSSAFPAFQPRSLPGTRDEQRRWMAYNGWDCANGYGCAQKQGQRVALGIWDNATRDLPGGQEGSGPLAVMAADGSRTVVLSASSSFMASSQEFITKPMPAPPPGPPAANASALFTPHKGEYCDSGHDFVYAANGISLEQCAEQCVTLGCDAFDFTAHLKSIEPYTKNCRVYAPGTNYRLEKSSGAGYDAYTRASLPGSVGPGVLAYGVSGAITSVPAGFSVEFMLAVGEGPNQAVRHWGSLLTTAYNKTNPEDQDYTTTHLGYDTDNGAYYYYNPEEGKTYEQTLYDVQDYARRVGIPYKHVQLDSWWYIKGAGGGTKSWTPGPNTFPQGLRPFHNRTGWHITAHNRMWAKDVTYATQNGGKFNWSIEGDEAVPTEQAFWDYLMAEAKGWGLYVYEQDWLFTEWVGAEVMQSSATLPHTWLMQMDAGAAKAGVVIQYCMLWPRMALASLEFPTVTTARGSTDYKAGGNDQWIMGLSSLFLDSLALRPTKDNYFSTDSQGNDKKGKERFNRLQALVSTLSTGPVFPSDAINNSDVPLILRSCAKDGLLLRPARACTDLDQQILLKALARATRTPDPGELQSTSSTVSGVTSYHVLAANTAAPTSVSARALIPGYKGASFVAYESNTSTAKLLRVDSTKPLAIPLSDRWSFTYHTVVPLLSNGFAFLGEADSKWIAVSPQRFTGVVANSDGVVATARGVPGEVLRLFWVGPGMDTPQVLTCTVGSAGQVVAKIAQDTQTCA